MLRSINNPYDRGYVYEVQMHYVDTEKTVIIYILLYFTIVYGSTT